MTLTVEPAPWVVLGLGVCCLHLSGLGLAVRCSGVVSNGGPFQSFGGTPPIDWESEFLTLQGLDQNFQGSLSPWG